MDDAQSVTEWGRQLGSPSTALRDEAARRLWERYQSRLLNLVRHNLDARIRRRAPESDIVQSMYRSFCLGRPAGREAADREELWRLMAHIAICKTRNATRRHRAGRRDVRREQPQPRDGDSLDRTVLAALEAGGPDAASAAALEDELETWLALLPPDLRQIALWKLEGYSNREIGDTIQRTERTVELKLRLVRARFQERLDQLEREVDEAD